MKIDIDTALEGALSSMKESVDGDWNCLEAHAKKVLENNKAALSELALMRVRGEITADELKSELEDESDTLRAEMYAAQVITKAMAQNAANAVTDALMNAVKIAI
ncbi:hypothetical protein BOW53_16240 [Solemya pervernicosa gill symbiont]|uniref:Uncharacterized protein n=1 Tax=Solemya pervernicosa gill symbiont TaxID=642797 RepID=A0A1T2KZI5_9GAMM|nr:hypothetical protein [Solemya pervernicosa gill symbiont]OOZ38214.1 hypothetical protein BOW53_16240 [Solemya pervernicosa gill symbiont]